MAPDVTSSSSAVSWLNQRNQTGMLAPRTGSSDAQPPERAVPRGECRRRGERRRDTADHSSASTRRASRCPRPASRDCGRRGRPSVRRRATSRSGARESGSSSPPRAVRTRDCTRRSIRRPAARTRARRRQPPGRRQAGPEGWHSPGPREGTTESRRRALVRRLQRRREAARWRAARIGITSARSGAPRSSPCAHSSRSAASVPEAAAVKSDASEVRRPSAQRFMRSKNSPAVRMAIPRNSPVSEIPVARHEIPGTAGHRALQKLVIVS